MPYDLSIADRLRAAGLRTTEIAGWRTRGSSDYQPRGGLLHHTAGSRVGTAPSLNGCIHGFSGSAPGPLCQVMQSREPDGRDIFYVIAAGRANHAGLGGWRGLSGNSTVVGLEVEHTGTEPLPIERQRLAARFHAAMARGRYSASMVCLHREWAPARKIDAATRVDPTVFRTMVGNFIAQPGDLGDDDLTPAQAQTLADCEALSRQARDLAHATRVEQGQIAKAEAAKHAELEEKIDTIRAQVAALAAQLS